jgi:DNA-binding IclR family transcriptional regulator
LKKVEKVPDKATSGRPNYQIRSVERALDVLEAFTAEEPALPIDVLCERTHLPKSTAFKILSVLEHRDYVQKSQDGGPYRIGFQAFEVGNKYLAGLTMLEIVHPFLKKLVRRFPQSAAHVAVLSPTETKIVYVNVLTRNTLLVPAPIGSQLWAHATALGKCLLAGLPEEALERRLACIEMPQLTGKTITDPQRLRAHLERVRAQGYALDDEELAPGNLCVAVPCRDRQGMTVASISTAHVKEAMTDDMAAVIAEMCQVAWEVSRAMGYAPAQPESECQ